MVQDRIINGKILPKELTTIIGFLPNLSDQGPTNKSIVNVNIDSTVPWVMLMTLASGSTNSSKCLVMLLSTFPRSTHSV